MPTPHLPTQEALKGGIAVIHKGSSTTGTELTGLFKPKGLLTVEDVAFTVVGRSAAWGLVSKLWAALNGQGLVCIYKGFTDGKGVPGGTFELD
jgi:hypothetical protein